MCIDERIKIKRIMENAFKQALNTKTTNQLPSNFSYKMMESIRKEALKKKRSKAFVDLLILFFAVAVILGLGIYVLFFYMDLGFTIDLLPNKEDLQDLTPNIQSLGNAFLFKFYSFIALIVLLLLLLDYKLHRRFFWK